MTRKIRKTTRTHALKKHSRKNRTQSKSQRGRGRSTGLLRPFARISRNKAIAFIVGFGLIGGAALMLTHAATSTTQFWITVSGFPSGSALFNFSPAAGTCGTQWTISANSTIHCYGSSDSQGNPLPMPTSGTMNIYSYPQTINGIRYLITYTQSGGAMGPCGTNGTMNCNGIRIPAGGSGSLSVTFTHAPDAPSLNASGATASSINLSWSESAPGTGVSYTSYVVKEGSNTVASLGGSASSYTVNSLSCGQSHSYTVTVTDNFSRSTSSNQLATSTSACPSSGSGGSGGSSGSSGSSPSGTSTGGSSIASSGGTSSAPKAGNNSSSSNQTSGSNQPSPTPNTTSDSSSQSFGDVMGSDGSRATTAGVKNKSSKVLIYSLVAAVPILGGGGYFILKLIQRRRLANMYTDYARKTKGL